ncbi:MAG: MATE family efflux transporter [bacterium]
MSDNNIKKDLTEGSIVKNIWILALPMVIEMVMQSTFNVIDLFWVGKLGPEAIASVSLSGVILMVYFSIIIGIATSSSALVARRIGAKDKEGANFIIFQAIFLGLIVSIFFGYIGFDNARFFITRLGATDIVIQEGTLYLQVMFAGSIAIVLLFIINGIFRGVGDAMEAMYVLLFSNILNIIIDPLLIFGIGPFPELGVKGAAVATILARSCGIIFQIYILINGTGRIKLSFKNLGIDFGIIWQIITIGIPASGQLLLRMIGMVVIMRIVALFGTFAIAAYGIAMRIFQIILFPGFGLGNASATLVGQNLGAGNPKRAEHSAWITGLITMFLLGGCSILFFASARTLIRIFNDNTMVISFGVTCIRIISISYLFNGLGVVLSRSFMGAGDTLSPFVINGLTLWLLQLPLAFVLAKPLDLGVNGIWLAITISNIMNVLISAAWFKVGRWKYKFI